MTPYPDPFENAARAISLADPLGPEDFDNASDEERRTYSRMARAAHNSAHEYAVHTRVSVGTLSAIADVRGAMTLYRDGDPFCTWGEPETPEGWDEHLVIGADDLGTVRVLMLSLSGHNEPSTATTFHDWSVPVEVPGTDGVRSWWDWKRENPDQEM